jgi:opacity protein-like surface antigen
MNISKARAALCVFPLCFGMFAGPAAQAAETGFYVGAYYGQASRDADIALFDADALGVYDQIGFSAAQTTSKLDDEDSAYGFTAGYRLTRHIAIEGGYAELGTTAYRAVSEGNFPGDEAATVNLNVDSETSGIALSALGILPISYTWELYVRGGVMFTTSTLKTFVTDGIGSARGEFSETSTDFLAGAGVSMAFLEIYGLRLEYQRVFDAGKDSALSGDDIDMLSLGVTVAF